MTFLGLRETSSKNKSPPWVWWQSSKSRMIQLRSTFLKQKQVEPLTGGNTDWQFWWIVRGWVRGTNVRMRKSWGLQSLGEISHTSMSLHPRTPQSSHGEEQRKIPLWLWQRRWKIIIVKYTLSALRNKGLLALLSKGTRLYQNQISPEGRAFLPLQPPLDLSNLRERGTAKKCLWR